MHDPLGVWALCEASLEVRIAPVFALPKGISTEIKVPGKGGWKVWGEAYLFDKIYGQ